MVDEDKYAATLEDAKQIAELAGIELSVAEGDEEDLAIDDRPHVDVDAPPAALPGGARLACSGGAYAGWLAFLVNRLKRAMLGLH